MGNFAAAVQGVLETIEGVSFTAEGGAITLTGVGAVASVPAMAVGVGLTGHGSLVVSRSVQNMKRVHNVNMSGNASAGNFKFPSAEELAKLLGVTVEEFHKYIKPFIKKDFARELKTLGTTNPDIGITDAGMVVLKNPITGATFVTDVPLSAYAP